MGYEGDSWHLSQYTHSCPTIYVDPDGEVPVVAIGVGVVAIGVAVVVLPDWGTDWLTDSQAHFVDNMSKRLLTCAKNGGFADIDANLRAMTVTAIFEPGKMEDDSVSVTKNGRFFGWSNRTILSADFFDRPCKSQVTTLLHESYHAGTEDWTETKSYEYAADSYNKLKCACPGLCGK